MAGSSGSNGGLLGVALLAGGSAVIVSAGITIVPSSCTVAPVLSGGLAVIVSAGITTVPSSCTVAAVLSGGLAVTPLSATLSGSVNCPTLTPKVFSIYACCSCVGI